MLWRSTTKHGGITIMVNQFSSFYPWHALFSSLILSLFVSFRLREILHNFAWHRHLFTYLPCCSIQFRIQVQPITKRFSIFNSLSYFIGGGKWIKCKKERERKTLNEVSQAAIIYFRAAFPLKTIVCNHAHMTLGSFIQLGAVASSIIFIYACK